MAPFDFMIILGIINWWSDLQLFWKWGVPAGLILLPAVIALMTGTLYLFPLIIGSILMLVNIHNLGKPDVGW